MKQAGECLQPIKTVLTGTMKQLKSVLLAMKKWIRLENASYLLQLFYYEEMKHQAGECLQPIECPIMKNLIWYWLTIKRISVENTLKAYQWAHASHLLTSCHFILLLGGTNLFEIVLLVGMKIALWCRDPPLKSVQFVVSRFTLKAITSLPFCYIVRPNVPITGKRGVSAWRKSEIRVFLYGSTLGQSVGVYSFWFLTFLFFTSISLPPLKLFNRYHNVSRRWCEVRIT